jgi:hypothetical protein
MPTTGRTWNIRFEDGTEGGTAKITYTVKKNGGTEDVQGKWEYNEPATAAEKAERFYQSLITTYAALVTASKSGNTVTFTLKSDNPQEYTDITGIKIDAGATKEKHTTWDDNGGPYIMDLVVAPYEAGGPVDPDGEIFLRVGPTNPAVRVDTNSGGQPRPIASINQEIVTTFNNLYAGTPYSAVLDANGNVLIAAVPCDAIVTCGSTDGFTGCAFSLNDQ